LLPDFVPGQGCPDLISGNQARIGQGDGLSVIAAVAGAATQDLF